MTLRRVSCLAMLAVLALTSAQTASVAKEPTAKTSQKQAAPEKAAEWTEADYKAVRARDEARQQLWDSRMKALTKGICTGC